MSGQAELLRNFLRDHPGIKKIRYQSVTYGNVNITRFLTVSRALDMVSRPPTEGGGINVVGRTLRNFAATGAIDHSFMAGDDLWIPDYSSLTPCAEDKDHASCMVNVIESHLVESPTPYGLCPRSTLRKATKAAEAQGYKLLMGSEIEFYFLTSPNADAVIPAPDLPLYNSAATRHPLYKIVDQAVDVLEENGIKVWGWHNEGASSKYEISLAPADPVTTIDNVVYATEVLKDIANKHGVTVTMHPNAFPGKWPTAGQHWHISIVKDGAKPGDSFLAGLLEHLPSLSAFLLGGYDSYLESRKFWYGGGPVMWSYGKGGPIRRFGESHFELRLGDTLCNPYLQAAAMLIAGMDGINRQTPLTMKPADGVLAADAMTEEHAKAIGVTRNLPTSLEEGVKVLKEDKGEWLTDGFGKELVDAYLRVKDNELKDSGAMDAEERRKAILRHI